MTAIRFGHAVQGAARRRGLIARIMAARELQARRQVSAYLGSLDDAALATYGYDRRAFYHAGDGRRSV